MENFVLPRLPVSLCEGNYHENLARAVLPNSDVIPYKAWQGASANVIQCLSFISNMYVNYI